MEILKESAPFIIGFFVPPILMFAVPSNWPSILRAIAVFVVALVLGASTSLLMGELADGLKEAVKSIAMDSAFVYTSSQVSYHLIWKPFLGKRLERDSSYTASSSLKSR